MPHSTENRSRSWARRALSAFLALILLVGIVPASVLPASAAHWADEYLNQLVDWGFMRADQIGNPDEPINRAQFVAIINRAYGYSEMGPIPFADVPQTEWFYDDISIAYTAGYMAGTSSATADPYGYLTREMATCILGRNMMMKDSPAESLAFTDSWMVSSWARGLVKTAVDNYVLSGYPDNSFRPQSFVSMGEMAVLVTRCVGTPINEPGEYTLGDVFDNVTITSSNVTLRDTTISGDLYVSGGVGLGDVKLENVTVLGRIIVSGTGESEKGDASVLLRNVTAQEMLVDNMRDKTVTVRAEGLTEIGRTSVRTNAYLEDNTPDENGLRLITVDGSGCRLDLAGRVKEVVAQAPMTTVQVAKGTVQRLTVDETATNSTVQVNRNTEVKELNLDVASSVTGDGDVKQMNINAPGVTSTVLPEKLYIRPGITGNVGGEDLDSAGAEEYSRDPKILSGYPIASDIAPTSLRADFATNKKGTVYWAVSNITDGSVSADDLIKPPSYGSSALKNGSIDVPTAETLASAQITGLTVSGSYYLSAVMADRRGVRSPVKVISFTTPDNTKPAFAQGYPKMTLVTDTLAQAVVMPTKSCKLYYAVLPQGAPAPTTNELRSASVTGNLGYGVLDVIKNTELTFIASRQLEELKDYVLYLWLCDADGVNSSNVQSLRFKTVDATPPKFDPEANNPVESATSVSVTVGLNEPGTIYWAAVPKGTPYPQPNNQSDPIDKDNIMSDDDITPVSAKLESEFAKLQVKNGRGAKSKGSVRVANAGTEVTMNVTGLAKETGYDLYYVGQDAAGNFTEVVKVISINTQDSTAPVVRQRFSRYTGSDDTQNPMANTDINLEFSEHITVGNSRDLYTLYQIAEGKITDKLSKDDTRASLISILQANFKLYRVDSNTGKGTQVVAREYIDDVAQQTEGWVVDYHNVIIQPSPTDASKLWVTFPSNLENLDNSALQLASGSQYYFEITGVRDNSGNTTTPSVLRHDEIARIPNSPHVLPIFETVFAIVDLSTPGVGDDTPEFIENKEAGKNNSQGENLDQKGHARVDASFRLTPQSTSSSDPSISYEIVLFSDYTIDFDLYYRILDEDGKPVPAGDMGLPNPDAGPDKKQWYYLGNQHAETTEGRSKVAVPINKLFNNCNSTNFPKLINMKEEYSYEFAISVTQKDYIDNYKAWSGTVNFDVYVLASQSNTLHTVTDDRGNLTPDFIKNEFDKGVGSGTGRSIGQFKSDDHMPFRAVFVDSQIPTFKNRPIFKPGDTFVDVTMTLDRAATVYYVITPRKAGEPAPIYTEIKPKTGDNFNSATGEGEGKMWDIVKKYMDNDKGERDFSLVPNSPPNGTIANYKKNYPDMIGGELDAPTGGRAYQIHIGPPDKGLQPLTDYYMYVVIEGQSSGLSEVFLYNFTTENTSKPTFNLTDLADGRVEVETQVPANVNYIAFTETAAERIKLLGEETLELNKVAGVTLPSKYENFTLLDALMEKYDSGDAGGQDPALNGYSVFDVYANDTAKTRMARLIRDGNPRDGEDYMVMGTLTTEGEDPMYLGTTNVGPNIVYNVDYILLTVGYHTSSERGPGDSFFAGPFHPVRALPPELEDFASRVSRSNDATKPTPFYRGSFTITLDSDLYIRKDGKVTPVENVKDQTDQASILAHIGKSVATINLEISNAYAGASSTFSFAFSGMEMGDQFTIFSDGEISSFGGQTHGSKKLTITLKETVSGKVHRPYLEAALNGKVIASEPMSSWTEMT